MSTFCGKIQEILQISVDRFDGENMQSEAYFLSHCHSDHMVGLWSYDFQKQLVANKKKLYASQISCVILRKMFPNISDCLRELHLYSPTTVHLTKNNFSVSPISAGHCPGSVMFLFESGNKSVLYTGDYRISKHDIQKFKFFYNSANEIKIIDKIYLDTTFFLKSYMNFPKREESLKELCEVVEEWIKRGNKFFIKLITSAKYGYEYVFNEIFKNFIMPVHVNQDMHSFYSLIPEMDQSVTMDGSLTQIHCNCGISFKQMCNLELDNFVKIIKISAWRWKQDDLKEGSSKFDSEIHYVCYSTHASYEEGVELIRFLKPKSIEACVKHNDPYANKEMAILIQNHLEEFKEKEEIKKTPQLFPIEDEISTKCRTFEKSFDDTDILNSPPRPTIDLDNTIRGDDMTELNCENNSNGTLSAIVSPVRRVKISEFRPFGETHDDRNVSDFESETDCQIVKNITVPSTTSRSNEEMRGTKEKKLEDSELLSILGLQSDNFSDVPKSIEGIENGSESLEYEKKDDTPENLRDLIDNSEDWSENKQWEDSVLLAIINTPPEAFEVNAVKGNEENSIIMSIIDSPPSKKKK
nr:protein artemis [Leptinotarsa decemlineata]